jgi:TyrR family helix-turn-helix protein
MDEMYYKPALEQLNNMYTNSIKEISSLDNWIFRSEIMASIVRKIIQLASLPGSILITGERGVEKRMLCDLVYERQKIKSTPYIVINCALCTMTQIENIFFTNDSIDSHFNKIYKSDILNNGVLVLEEVSTLSVDIQFKLLNIINTLDLESDVNIRIVATTSNNLEHYAKEGRFSQELYNKISVNTIELVPLRYRKEDIELIAQYYHDYYCKYYARFIQLSPSAIKSFIDYDWPGNLEEMKNTIENLVLTTKKDVINSFDLPLNIYKKAALNSKHQKNTSLLLDDIVSKLEKEIIESTLVEYGSLRNAAKILGISHTTIARRLKKANMVLGK